MRPAIFVEAVDVRDRVRGVGIGDHAAALVGMGEVAPVVRILRAVVPDEELVHPGAVDVAVQIGAGLVIFPDQRVAVIGEPARARALAHLVEPPERVVEEARAVRRARQLVLRVVIIVLAADPDDRAVASV